MTPKPIIKSRSKSHDSLKDIFENNLIEYKKVADNFFSNLNSAIDPIGAKLILILERFPNKTEDEKMRIASIKSKFNSTTI